MNRRRGSLAGSPLLIGALATLIIVVAVYISYNANNGLPFTPTYNIEVVLPAGSNLQKSNQVRVGGTRVGVIESLAPHQNPRTGKITVIAKLRLEKAVEPLPKDTKAIVQSVSSVGLKYLSLERGHSNQGIPQGGRIPLSQTRQPVDIGEFFDMFNKLTRVANQRDLTNFGNGFAGRGLGLNEALAELPPIVKNLTPVMRNLAAAQTGLANLFPALDRAAKEAAPVAAAQGRMWTELNTFFGAWAEVVPSLEAAIEGGPESLRQATYSLAYEAPFIRKNTEFMRLLRPSAEALVNAAPPLGEAFELGARNFKRAVSLNGEIASSSQAVQSFAENPIVELALEDLTQTATAGTPFVSALAEDQAGCNYITLAFRNVASAFSESIGVGTMVSAVPILAPEGPNSEGKPASAPASGTTPSYYKEPKEYLYYKEANYLHYNPYPDVAKCEAGNEEYEAGKTVIGNAGKLSNGESVGDVERTNRDESRFSEPYEEESTLKDLGLPTGKKKKGGKKK